MLVSDAGSILLKRDIQHPMQTVFNRPVLRDRGDLPLVVNGHTGQKIPFFCCDGSMWFDHPNRFHRQDALDARPVLEYG